MDHRKNKGITEQHLLRFPDYTKAFDCVDHSKLWKILKEMGLSNHLTYLLRNLYAGQKAVVRNEHETMDWFSKLGKEYIKAVYCHLAYLIYMQSTSCKMLDWMKLKLESRLPGEISITSYMQITPLLRQKEELSESEEPPDESERGE